MEENKTTQDPFMQAIQGDVDSMPGITETARETTENIGSHKMLSTDSIGSHSVFDRRNYRLHSDLHRCYETTE